MAFDVRLDVPGGVENAGIGQEQDSPLASELARPHGLSAAAACFEKRTLLGRIRSCTNRGTSRRNLAVQATRVTMSKLGQARLP